VNKRPGACAGAGDASQRQEQAAPVALLRATTATWPDVTADVLEAGSALAVRRDRPDEHEPATLLGPPDTGDADFLAAATTDIARRAERGLAPHRHPRREPSLAAARIHRAPPSCSRAGRSCPAIRPWLSRDRGTRLAGGLSIAHELAERKISVAAGLARGIGTAAHRTALDDGGQTVAVIGTGISRVYPPENAGLHEEIAARGLLLPQFWPDASPQKDAFLMRNATMPGYALATIVAEAGKKTGARMQARLAVEHGLPVVPTDLVAERNERARAMTGRPGVQMASGPREAARSSRCTRTAPAAGGAGHRRPLRAGGGHRSQARVQRGGGAGQRLRAAGQVNAVVGVAPVEAAAPRGHQPARAQLAQVAGDEALRLAGRRQLADPPVTGRQLRISRHRSASASS
jgi:DNA processing protein